MLAERPLVSSLMLVAAAAAIGLLATERPQVEAPEIVFEETTQTPPIPEECPNYVRDRLHVDADAALYCARGKGVMFVVARYTTTEVWERAAIIRKGEGKGSGIDMIDRPGKPGWAPEFMFVTDVNGDGVEEAFVGFASEWGRHRTDIIELRSGSVRFDYFSE